MHSFEPSRHEPVQIQRQKLIDGSAMGLSLLCLFHCLAMPLVVSVLPLLGAHLFEETTIHVFFFATALPLSFFGLWLGVRGAHGGKRLMVIAGFGLLLMFAGALHDISGEYDVAFTSVGVSFVALAHFLNWRRHARTHSSIPHEHHVGHSDHPCDHLENELEAPVAADNPSATYPTSGH